MRAVLTYLVIATTSDESTRIYRKSSYRMKIHPNIILQARQASRPQHLPDVKAESQCLKGCSADESIRRQPASF